MDKIPSFLSIEDASVLIKNNVESMPAELVPVRFCAGRILAEDITARENIPPFPRSPYDGYAFRSEDVAFASEEQPVTLQIIEEVPAGYAPVKAVGPGQAVKILTGAPIPGGADAVCKYEDTDFTPDEVRIFQPAAAGSNIVPEGEDLTKGTVVCRKGTRIDPAVCGLLAGLGYAQVPVFQKPRIALISTGTELVDVGQPLTPGKIRNSSVYTIQAWLEELGMETEYAGIAPDDPEALAEALKDAAGRSDVVVTTGGVSVGDYDYLPEAVSRIKADVLVRKVRMKPGSAFLASVYQGKLILSLSGNPSAAMMALLLVGLPALRKLGGHSVTDPERIRVILKNDYPKGGKPRRMVPGRLEIIDGQAYLNAAQRSGNGMISPMIGCDLVGEIEPERGPLKAGSEIWAYRIRF